ncbi:MAG: invasion-like protein [Xanthobacteraceae bacterium]|jgi:invasion protein IalB|nr:invasion-like protein [Xanthobacteraceae bacterium]
MKVPMRIRSGLLTLLAGFALGCSTLAHAQDATLPGGASSLRESHGDWVVNCAVQAQNGRNVKSCALSQEQTDNNTRQRVLGIELRPGDNSVQGILVMPFGLALEQGIAFQIDDGAFSPAQKFRTCLPAGCLVPVSFDARTLAALRKGTQLKIKAVADGGKETPFTISLKGFPGAYDRTVALAK